MGGGLIPFPNLGNIGKLDAVFLLELVYAAANVDKLLLASVERMAVGADFHTKVLLDRAGFECVSASAGNSGYVILRMNRFFHFFHLFLPWFLIRELLPNQSYIDTWRYYSMRLKRKATSF